MEWKKTKELSCQQMFFETLKGMFLEILIYNAENIDYT